MVIQYRHEKITMMFNTLDHRLSQKKKERKCKTMLYYFVNFISHLHTNTDLFTHTRFWNKLKLRWARCDPHSCTGRDKCNTSVRAHTQHCHRSRPAQQGDNKDEPDRRVSSSRCCAQFCMDLHSERKVKQNANQQNWARNSTVRTRPSTGRLKKINK